MSDPADDIRDILDDAQGDKLSRIADVLGYPETPAPIDMVLHCPACGLQHIDAVGNLNEDTLSGYWTNPPHRSHLCHGCCHIWRPADVPTNGVQAVKTKGANDREITDPPQRVTPARGRRKHHRENQCPRPLS